MRSARIGGVVLASAGALSIGGVGVGTFARRLILQNVAARHEAQTEDVTAGHRKDEVGRTDSRDRVGRVVVCADHVGGAVTEAQDDRTVVVKLNVTQHRSGPHDE